jgi:hypothetical protein
MALFREAARPFILIHINKTGGSSVEQALGLRFEHLTALEKIAQIGRPQWDSAYTFAFIRNPWDKVVSHYHYRVQTNQTNLATDPLTFAQWVSLTYGRQDPAYYDNAKMFMPQVDWITDAEGKLLVNFVGRFERLAADFKTICRHLGREATLPHLKASKRGHYRDYYDEPTQAIVAEWFRKDIERFAYRF